ncbi:hypothetical protein [Microbacterium pumilum]|uniref:hypothetical protein n=1 Tax=Microbacterium pumilum TaxID=344165 RepID=UPI0031DD56C5
MWFYLAWFAIEFVAQAWAVVRPQSFKSWNRNELDVLLGSLVERPAVSVIIQFLELPAFSLAWPALARTSLSALKRKTNRQWLARYSLRPIHGQVSVFLACVLFVVLILNDANLAWKFLLASVTWLVLIAVILKEVSYLISPLPDRLRRSNVPPWPLFALVAVADATALTLAVANLRSLQDGGGRTVTRLLPSFLELINVPDNITSLLAVNVTAIPIAVVGLLYSTAMVKTLVSFSHFTRTDEDYRSLAELSVLAGNTEDGAKWIAKVKQHDVAFRTVDMQIALASGAFDDAAIDAGRVLVSEEEPDTRDRRLMVLTFYALLLPLTSERASDFIRYFFENTSDSAAASFLPDLFGEYPDEVTAAVDGIDRESAPLTFATVMRIEGDLAKAAAVLEEARPGSELEEVVRLVALGVIHLYDPTTSEEEDEDYALRWRQSAWPVVKALSADLSAAERVIPLMDLIRLEFALGEIAEVDDEDVSTSESELAVFHRDVYEVVDTLGSHDVVERSRKLFLQAVEFRISKSPTT